MTYQQNTIGPFSYVRSFGAITRLDHYTSASLVTLPSRNWCYSSNTTMGMWWQREQQIQEWCIG